MKKIMKLLSCLIPVEYWKHIIRGEKKAYEDEIKAHISEYIIKPSILNKNNVDLKKCDLNNVEKFDYSIGIVTYNKRFNKYFVPLINKIRETYKGEIIVCINGTHKEEFDEIYRKDILAFFSQQEKIYPMMFTDFRSLSKCWNNCLINSPKRHMVLLNDDLTIDDNRFWDDLEMAIIQQQKGSFRINGTWSSVYLDIEEIERVGWFDERLLGVGWEDTDFQLRYFKKTGQCFARVNNIRGLVNHVDDQDTVLNQKVACGKYSKFNKDFFFKKYKIGYVIKSINQVIKDAKQYQTEKFYREHKDEM